MPLQPLDLTWALTASLPPLDFVLPGLLPGTFGLVVATGATGKSQLALDVAASLSLGRSVAGGLFPGGRFSLVQLHTATPKGRAVGGARLLTT